MIVANIYLILIYAVKYLTLPETVVDVVCDPLERKMKSSLNKLPGLEVSGGPPHLFVD